ncbi:MAG TPA: 2-C-methyl-D-erythritol 2,4-cyclodiphosphate synthase [Candidatus Limnocylindrales bacterium]
MTARGSDREAAESTVDVIVVAAGASRRMGGVDKLWVDVAGEPLLARTLQAVAASPAVTRIVLVVAADRVAAATEAAWLPESVVSIVAGGGSRHDSVRAGFEALEQLDAGRVGGSARAGDAPVDVDDGVVLVHDAARPFVTTALIAAVAAAAARYGAAIPVLPVAETLKRVVDGRVDSTIDREGVATAQTPQGVRRGILRSALAGAPAAADRTWTDEAALLEACRIAVHAIPGEATNVKVTLPADLQRAEAVFGGGRRGEDAAAVGNAAARVGLGHDRHSFGPGEPLLLGGVAFPGVPRLFGHSDGDVALHAVADALLGAASLGDLGRLFPADARTPRGSASSSLLTAVVERVAAAGYRPRSVDVTIVAARPRLADRLDEMAATIAALLGLPTNAVAVKASTGNLDGMEGAGRGISAQAVALLDPAR